MEQVTVHFITEEKATWVVEMTHAQLSLIAQTRPYIDADNGSEVYEIDEFRYDLDDGTYSFWLKFISPEEGANTP